MEMGQGEYVDAPAGESIRRAGWRDAEDARIRGGNGREKKLLLWPYVTRTDKFQNFLTSILNFCSA